jgi:catechol 2,3-dioxygenase-like lactoylglutathione lyase family enzyme
MRFVALLSLLIAPTMALQAPPKAATPKRTTSLGGIGIAVSSIEKSRDFYVSTLGYRDTGVTYKTPQFDELVLQLPGEHTGSAIVLMKWKDNRVVKDVPVKLAFYVPNVKTSIDKMRAVGSKVVLEPGAGVIGNTSIPTGMAKDPDGYLLELNPLSSADAIDGAIAGKAGAKGTPKPAAKAAPKAAPKGMRRAV